MADGGYFIIVLYKKKKKMLSTQTITDNAICSTSTDIYDRLKIDMINKDKQWTMPPLTNKNARQENNHRTTQRTQQFNWFVASLFERSILFLLLV